VLAVARQKWADFAGPEKSLEQMVSESVGPYEAVELLQGVRANTVRTYSELLQFRPDLSYMPPMK
jgi:hypothetical protein